MYLQEIWIAKTDWEALSPELSTKTKGWTKELATIPQLQIPRCLQESSKKVISSTLHFFCDASVEAMVLWAIIDASMRESITVRLIAAKTKLAPIRSMSIPRLELEAAFTSIKLSKVVARCLNVEKQNIVFLSDGMNTIWWITRRIR